MTSGTAIRGGTADGRDRCVLRLFSILAALVFVLAVAGASFGQTIWTATTNNWNTPGNWTLGVPNSASGTTFDAQIRNGGTAQLSESGASVRRMRVGVSAGGGHLEVNGGGLTVTDDVILNFDGTGLASTTVQNGGIVTVPATVVGDDGTGQSNFLITGAGSGVNATSSFVVGRSASATLSLADGGTLAVGNGTLPLRLATQSGSTAYVNIGNGGAGVLQASEVRFGVGDEYLEFNHTGNLLFATPITGLGIVRKSGPGTTTLSVANSYTGATQVFGGTLAINADANLGMPPGSLNSQQLLLNGGTLRATQSFTLADTRDIAFGVSGGTIEVDATKTLTYPDDLILGSAALTKTGTGVLSLSKSVAIGFVGTSTLLVTGGGTLTTTSDGTIGLSSGTGTVTVRGAGSIWNMANLTIGQGGNGTLNIEDQGLVDVQGELRLRQLGIVNLSGGTLRLNGYTRTAGAFNFNSGTIQLVGNRSIGSDATIQDLFGAAPTINTAKGLTVEGTATLSKPLTIEGGTFKANSLVIGAGGALDFDRGLLELTGGAITGLASLTVPTNGEFRASGVQSLRIIGAAASTITATGNLTLGNAAAVNGFGTQGMLQVGAHSVTLLDANDVVFDSLALATLGNAGSPGTLTAANGLTLDFGGNVTGFGTISAPNNVAKPLINNGHITGNSIAQPLTLSGYVKGVGTFNNVNLTGTFAPGLSPTRLIVGNVAFSPTSTLLMELGGTTPGSGHDQIQSSGVLALDGTLAISLINGFAPSAGNSFEILTYLSRTGDFDDLVGDYLGEGLFLDPTFDADSLTLVTTQAGPGDTDLDGDVDLSDLGNLATGFGLNNANIDWINGDFDHDDDVDLNDLGTLATFFNGGRAQAYADFERLVAVPEPSAAVALLLSAGPMRCRRRPPRPKEVEKSHAA